MPVIVGTPLPDNRLRISAIWYKLDEHPDGYSVSREQIPDYPPAEPGVDHVMVYDRNTNQFSFDRVERPLTPEESVQATADQLSSLKERVTRLEERVSKL